MNIYPLLGLLFLCSVVGYSLFLASENWQIFWDVPSLFIVIGGTLGAISISMQLNRFPALFKIFLKRWFFGKKHSNSVTIKEMMAIAEGYRKGESLANLKSKTKDDFLLDALTMLEDSVLSQDEVMEILEDRNDLSSQSAMEEANKVKGMAKYPPGFGMIGTVIGMLVLLSNLGGEDAMKMIGPAMSICLITTLYGSMLSNMFFSPVGDNLADDTKETYLKNQIIIEGVRLLIRKANPIIVAEKLNSYVPLKERVDWKKMVSK